MKQVLGTKVIINYKDKNDDADIYFGKCVEPNSIWDHKWQLSALFPSMGLSRRYHHVYIDKEIPYDVWSNIDLVWQVNIVDLVKIHC